MSNIFHSIMQSAYVDQMVDCGRTVDTIGGMDASIIRGSLHNPLLASRLMCIDPQGDGYEARAIAQVIGVPEQWLNADKLVAPENDVIMALGKLELIRQATLRNEALSDLMKADEQVDCLGAVAALPHILAMNAKLSLH